MCQYSSRYFLLPILCFFQCYFGLKIIFDIAQYSNKFTPLSRMYHYACVYILHFCNRNNYIMYIYIYIYNMYKYIYVQIRWS